MMDYVDLKKRCLKKRTRVETGEMNERGWVFKDGDGNGDGEGERRRIGCV